MPRGSPSAVCTSGPNKLIDNYVGRLAIAVLRPAAKLLGLVLRRDHDLTLGDEIVWMKMLGGGSLLVAMPMLLGFRRAHPRVKWS